MKYGRSAIGLCALFMAMITQCHAEKPFFPKLTVNGSAHLEKPADEITFTLTVLTQAETSEKALSSNNEKMQDLVAALLEEGLVKGEYRTGQFSIQPVYTPYPKNPLPDFKPSIIAYDVTNSLTIKTQRLELAPLVIDAAAKAGVDQLSNIGFGIKDPRLYRSEAIAEATANAMQDAQVLADSAKVEIVRVLDIKLDQPQVRPYPGPNVQYLAKSANSALFLEAPDVELNANVTIIFQIK